MLQIGSLLSETRELDPDDIFCLRIKLLIVMAKAYLESYPLGEYRCQAMLENVRHIENINFCMEEFISRLRRQADLEPDPIQNNIFPLRIKLLLVMIKAIASGCPMEGARTTALANNLTAICETLLFTHHIENCPFLKVA